MTTPMRNANGGLLTSVGCELRPNPRPLAPAFALATAGSPTAVTASPLLDDRLEWTPEDLASCLGCRPQKITYHCRQLERRGRLLKTDGVWRFDHSTACLLLKHVVDNGHQKCRSR